MVVVEVVVREPRVRVWAAAPVATLVVLAWAPVPIEIAPVPELREIVGLVVALPIVIPLALAVPMLMVPAVWVAVPTSRVMLPELDVVPVALPDWIVMALLLVLAVLVSLLATPRAFSALKA